MGPVIPLRIATSRPTRSASYSPHRGPGRVELTWRRPVHLLHTVLFSSTVPFLLALASALLQASSAMPRTGIPSTVGDSYPPYEGLDTRLSSTEDQPHW